MKTISVIAICAFLLLCAGVSYPQQSEEICCTWTNTKYEASERPQKVIFNYDGTYEIYPSEDSIDPTTRGVFQIDAKWKDTKGVIWYKIKMVDMYGANYNLLRISKAGESLEFVGKPFKYPDTINREASGYSIYSRTVLK